MEIKVLELKEMWHLGSLYEDMTMDELHGFQWPWITEAAALILFGGEKKQTATEDGCTKGRAKHHKWGNPFFGHVQEIQTSGSV